MIRGCQKRIYYVKDTRSALFAEAYFILKGEGSSVPGEAEMASEALRIVENFTSPAQKRFSFTQNGSAGQKIGAASSSAVIGGIALLLAFA